MRNLKGKLEEVAPARSNAAPSGPRDLTSETKANATHRQAEYRPCVVVLAVVEDRNGKIRVRVAPITHSPKSPETGLSVPRKLARHLGFEDDESWISLRETNEFYWPGVDLMPVKKANRGVWEYGVLPFDFFEALKQQLKLTLERRNTFRRE
jgi:hypothetical protein